MKKVIIWAMFLITLNLNAQEDQMRNKFGLDFQGNAGIFMYSQFVAGGASIDNQFSPAIGISYGFNFKERFWFETGLLYQKVKSEVKPAPTGLPSTSYSAETQWLEIPFAVRRDFKKLMYLKGGLNLVIQTEPSTSSSIDDQSGIGASMAVGFDIRINQSIHVEIEPGLKALSIVPFSATTGYRRHYVSPFIGVRLTYRK